MKVSICIPCYEQVEYLKMCMDSILTQTYDNFEVIISDDSKTDIVSNYINELMPVFSGKLYYHKNIPAKGTPDNWNHAMNFATGDLVHLLHHDDYYTSPDSLSNMVVSAQTFAETDVFVGEVVSHNVSDETLTKLEVSDTYLQELHSNPERIFYANLIGPPSIIFFRKSALTYFDINMKWLVDMEYYYRLFKINMNWRYVKKPFITSVNNAGHNVTNDCLLNPVVEVYEYLYFYNKHFNSFVPSIEMIRHFIMLIKRYGIFSLSEMRNYSRNERIPVFMYLLIYALRYGYIFKQKK